VPHVQLQEQAIVAEHPLGQPLDDRRLAHARLTDQDGVVRAPLSEDVEELVGLALAADCGIQLSFRRERREVARVGGEPGVFAGVERPARLRARRFRPRPGSGLRSGSSVGGTVPTRVEGAVWGAALVITAARAVGAATATSLRRGMEPVR